MQTEGNPWKIVSEQTVYDNNWIGLTEYQVINPAGNPGIYGKIRFKNIAIGVFPLDEELNTYLVGQFRFPLNQYSWEMPEGGGAIGTDPLTSAQRELLEETGLVAKSMTLVNVYSGEEFYYKYPHGDQVYNVVATYICRKFEGELKKEESEVQELNFFSINNLPNNLSPPDMPIIREYIKNYIGLYLGN